MAPGAACVSRAGMKPMCMWSASSSDICEY